MTWIKICLVNVILLEATMTSFNDRIEKICKHIVGFFISSYHANCHDERMAWIIDTSLDSSVEGEATHGLLASKLQKYIWVEALCHVVVVHREVWVVLQQLARLEKLRRKELIDVGILFEAFFDLNQLLYSTDDLLN